MNTANDIIGGLTTLFGGSNSGGSNEYITAPGVEPLSQSLKQDVKLSLQKWAPNTKVDDIYAAYSDLAVRSAKALCQVKARHAPTVWFDDKLTVIRRAMGEWRILSGEGGTKTALCLNPEDCVSKRRRTIQDLITKEDQALIDAADVKAKWTSLSVDNVTPTPDSYWQTMLKYLGITGAQPTDESYISQREAILFGLRDIELRVAALKSNWQWRATQEWAAATTAMDTLRKSLNAADYHIKQLDRQVWELAAGNMRDAKRSISLAKNSIEHARRLDPRLIPVAAEGIAKLDAMETEAKRQAGTICDEYLSLDSRWGQFNSCKAHQDNPWDAF